MVSLASLEFARPLVLWALIAIPIVAIMLVLRERLRRRLANRFVSERLRGVWNPARPIRPWALSLAFFFSVIAAAGPRLGYERREVSVPQSNRIIVVDVSDSMAAEDVGTSRLEASKAIAKRLIDNFEGRVGLVIFEAKADTISPLTNDTEAVLALLDSVSPGDVGESGSDLGEAVRVALKVAEAAGPQDVQIVVISDGEDRSGSVDDAVALARAKKVRISTIAVGTTKGAYIPTGDTREYLKDENGQTVVTASHPETLARLAAATGGQAFVNPFSAPRLDVLASALDEAASVRRGNQQNRVPVERYQWPLAAAAILFGVSSLANRGAE